MITIVEQAGHSLDSHVEVAGEPETGVGGRQSSVVSVSSDQGGNHLGGSGSTKVPVVGGLGPCTISLSTLETVVEGVGNGQSEDFGCSVGRVVFENSESGHGQTSIVDTVPVSVDHGGNTSPPGVSSCLSGLVVLQSIQTECETISDDSGSDSGLLLVIPVVIKPVVSNSKGSTELSDIEEMFGVPSVSGITERDLGNVSRRSLHLLA